MQHIAHGSQMQPQLKTLVSALCLRLCAVSVRLGLGLALAYPPREGARMHVRTVKTTSRAFFNPFMHAMEMDSSPGRSPVSGGSIHHCLRAVPCGAEGDVG